MSFWAIRILFLLLCISGGVMVSLVREEFIAHWYLGAIIGFGFGGLLIAVDEMLKGFSLRAFSASTFGLLLGFFIAWLVDKSGLFIYVEERLLWLIRLCLFIGFGYLGMVLAMRSNKEDFSLIIPYVRFTRQNELQNLVLLDTSAIVDGRVADLIEHKYVEGIIIVPRFVLRELQQVADSSDAIKRGRGRRGLEMLNRIRRNAVCEVKIHEADFPEEKEVDAKLVLLAKSLNARLYTTDYNLGKVAELQAVKYLNLQELSNLLKTVILPGENFNLRIVREGKDKGQGVGYLNDGTMVVVNQGHSLIGQQVQVQVQSLLQTGAGVIVFADVKSNNPA
ncbi:MAG: TRAM domain-containing protein [Verrucomicrobiota bacterium]